MHYLTTLEMVSGWIVFALAIAFIILLIAAGFKVAYDAKDKEREHSFNRRVERLAREMVKQRLDGCKIQVTQRISVIEDDLRGDLYADKR